MSITVNNRANLVQQASFRDLLFSVNGEAVTDTPVTLYEGIVGAYAALEIIGQCDEDVTISVYWGFDPGTDASTNKYEYKVTPDLAISSNSANEKNGSGNSQRYPVKANYVKVTAIKAGASSATNLRLACYQMFMLS